MSGAAIRSGDGDGRGSKVPPPTAVFLGTRFLATVLAARLSMSARPAAPIGIGRVGTRLFQTRLSARPATPFGTGRVGSRLLQTWLSARPATPIGPGRVGPRLLQTWPRRMIIFTGGDLGWLLAFADL